VKLFVRKIADLRGDEEGQTLAFGALSAFIVLLFVSLVVNFADVASRRVQMQRAADSAAYSAALVQADCASAVAFINTAMARVRYRMLRMTADVNIYGCLAELTDRAMNTQSDGRSGGSLTDAQVAAAVWGDVPNDADARLLYKQAYEEAKTWIPAGRLWLRDMAKLERGIAILAQRLPAETAYRIARGGGAELASIFPSQRWFPRNAIPEVTIYIDKLVSSDGALIGWRITGLQDIIEIRRMGQNSWRIYTVEGGESLAYSITQLTEESWLIEELVSGETLYIYSVDGEFMVTAGSDGVSVVSVPGTDPREYVISTPDGTERIRYNNGIVEVLRRDGFVPMSATQVNVGGIPVNVQDHDPHVRLPGNAGVLHLWTPPAVSIGDLLVQMTDPLSVSGWIGGVRIEIQGESLSIGKRWHLLNLDSADGKWRDFYDWDEEYWWRHRLTPLDPLGMRWQYQYQERGAYLTSEQNMVRMLAHRDLDLDMAGIYPEGGYAGPAIPRWLKCAENPAGWLSGENGKLVKVGFKIAPNDSISGTVPLKGCGADESDYFDNVEAFNRNRRPLKTLQQSHYDELWESGAVYFQLRECWDERDPHKDGTWPSLRDEFGRPYVCQTCFGRDHDGDGRSDVLVTTGDVAGRRGALARAMPAPEAALDEADWMETDLSPQAADSLDGDPFRPLVLSDEFFRWGVTVGLWRGREASDIRTFASLLNDEEIGSAALMQRAADAHKDEGVVGGPKPPWGFFVVSAARPRLNVLSIDGLPFGIYRFNSVVEREDWVRGDMNNLYFQRDSGQYGAPDWDAVLCPTRHQILDADTAFDALAAELGNEEIGESGAGYIYRVIAEGKPYGWTSSFDEYRRPRTTDMTLNIRCDGGPPQLRGGKLDYSRMDFGESVKH